MGSRCFQASVSLMLWCQACGPPELPAVEEPVPVVVTVDPTLASEAIGPVARLRVPASIGGDLGELLLFEGEVGEYHERRIRREDLPRTLTERQVPAVGYSDPSTGDQVVAPTRRLEEGRHSLVSTERGLLFGFTVSSVEDAPTVAERVWPPGEGVTAGRHLVHCGVELSPRVGETTELWPGPVPGEVTRVASDDEGRTCVWIEARGALVEGAELVGPLELGGVLLEPGSLHVGAPAAPASTPCVSPETPLGPGCARVLDDRVLLRPPVEPTLWWVLVENEPSRGATVRSTMDGATVVLRGLEPSRRHSLHVLIASPRGELTEVEAHVTTSEARPHVVIDEVLANPAGAEPAQEWVELVNDGLTVVDLAGWRLMDSAGGEALPPFALAPGERALVVRDDFASPAEPDVSVAPSVRLVRVPSIGANGLSNAGEFLTLVAPDGRTVSTFPAIAAQTAGQSICRRAPWAADELWAFGPHAPPGASPGLPCEQVEQ